MSKRWLVQVAAVCVLCACVLATTGCKFQREPSSPFAEDAGLSGLGPEGEGGDRNEADPDEQEDASDEGVSSAGAGSTSADDDSGTGGSTDGAAGTGALAGSGGGAAGSSGIDAIDPQDASTFADSGESCAQADVAVCNPVTNDGCLEGTQCVIDFLAGALAGSCIFSTPFPTEDLFCLNTGVTESCPPTLTCVDGVCRKLCFCDADCEMGECCAEPIGDQGFKACGAC